MYETDFSNFDSSTGIDIPLVGKNGIWQNTRGSITKSTRTIDGVTYSCLYVDGASATLTNISEFVDLDKDVATFEAITYKDSYTGIGGGCETNGTNPTYNCYSGGRGFSINAWRGGTIQTFNGYYVPFEKYYFNPNASEREITKLNVGGIVIDKPNGLVKFYQNDKKAIIQQPSTITNYYRIYGDNGFNYCVMKLRIYKGVDLFEQKIG